MQRARPLQRPRSLPRGRLQKLQRLLRRPNQRHLQCPRRYCLDQWMQLVRLVRHSPVQARVSVVRLEPPVQGRELDHRRHPGGLAGPERLRR